MGFRLEGFRKGSTVGGSRAFEASSKVNGCRAKLYGVVRAQGSG